MYQVTGSWAGYQLYVEPNLQDLEAVDSSIEKIRKRFLEQDYELRDHVKNAGIVPEVLCITAVNLTKETDRIVRRADIKNT